jgi:hypothetical protein
MKEQIVIPLAKSLITGFFIGAGVFVLLVGSFSMGFQDAAKTGLMVWVLSSSVYWVFGLSAPGPGNDQPPDQNYKAMVTINRIGGAEGGFLTIPIDRETWVKFCNKAYPKFETAETIYIGPGGVMSAGKFGKVRKELIDRGFAYWKNPKHHPGGWEFNAVGRAFIKWHITHPPEGVVTDYNTDQA